MNQKTNNSEKGQAIIYLVLGLVVFLGFVALAIDGGMALADRRHLQNASDSASLAGGGKAAQVLESAAPVCYANWTCYSNSGDAEAHAQIAARDRADANGFNIDNNISDHNGYDVTCSDVGEKYIDVTVLISDTTQSNFLQVVYPDAIHNEVDSVTRVHPSQPIGIDEAIIGLNPQSCGGNNGVTFSGSSTIEVEGGDVFSNGCIRGDGTPGTAVVTEGDIEGHYTDQGGFNWNPTPQVTDELLEPSDYYIEPPALKANGDCLEGTTVNNLPNTLTGGLWCVKGNLNINPPGISLANNTQGVTIYMLNGHLTIASNVAVDLRAPTTHANGGIPGILFFVPNGGSVTINGTSDDHLEGLVYAPKSNVSLIGSAENFFYGQVIGWNVKISGTNDMNLYYNECNGYQRPAFIELYK